jgi:hypothetical protein
VVFNRFRYYRILLKTALKKIVSIALLIVFLFNLGGYYIFFWGLMIRSDLDLTARLDADAYVEEEVIELKAPLAIPYGTDQESLPRINSRIEHRGEYYRMVKQRLVRDTLHLVFIKDNNVRKLSDSRNDFTRLTQESNSGEESQQFNFSKLPCDFEPTVNNQLEEHSWWCRLQDFRTEVTHLCSSFFPDIPHPPRA